MDTLIFSQAAIFRLHQLDNQYYHHTGERYRLANENGILDLLENSASIADRKIRRAYFAFIMELDKNQINALEERGVRLRLPANLH
ncbi:MAG: hypothetical protein EOP53_21940 [Sphingobacteriales bacterium]|nr:MAG: hypothetical protein EOP53_21940 [Sphingobacteriales bacterium]